MSLQEPDDDGAAISHEVHVPSTWPVLGFSKDSERKNDEVAATDSASQAAPRPTSSQPNFITRALSDALRTSEVERLVLQDQVHKLQAHLQRAGGSSQESSAGGYSGVSAAPAASSSDPPSQEAQPTTTLGLALSTQARMLRFLAAMSSSVHPHSAAAAQLSKAADALTDQNAHEVDVQVIQLLDQLQPSAAPPLPSSPARAPPSSTAGGGPPPGGDSPPSSPQSTVRDTGVQIPPTPASVRASGAASSTGRAVLREQLYSPDEPSPVGAQGGRSLRLWGQPADEEEISSDLPEGTPVPGMDGAPVPAFAYGPGRVPYPSRPSHPLHRHGGERKTSDGVQSADRARGADGGDDSGDGDGDGALLQALAGGEEGSVPASEANSPASESSASMTTVPSPFVSHTSTRRISPQKRSKFAAGKRGGALQDKAI